MGWLSRLLGAEPAVRPVSLNDGNFDEEVISSDVPVLVDVWGKNCAPCRMLEPVILELSKAYAGRVKVCELAAHANPRTTARLGVRGTPTVVYFHKGREVERVVGFRSSLYHKEAIQELFDVSP